MSEVLPPLAAIGPPARYVPSLHKSMRVPMRDGTRLSTDLYFPQGAAPPLPVVLLRTPYNKRQFRADPLLGPRVRLFVGQGYAVAVQDMRGRFESEGEFTVGLGDAADGYDTVDWLVRQVWCDGNVGTYGCSYMGETQLYQARLCHPNVRAMIPAAAGGATGSAGGRYTRWGFRHGGALNLASTLGWMLDHGSKLYARLPGTLTDADFGRYADLFDLGPRKPTVDLPTLWRHLPVLGALEAAGVPPNDLEAVLAHEHEDPWWNQFDYFDEGDVADVPILHVDSWFDPCVADTLGMFNYLRQHSRTERACEHQYVMIGPGAHCQSEYASEHTVVGALEVGDARRDHWHRYVRWFDHWLKGVDTGITTEARVQYFLLGANEWRTADAWPPSGTAVVSLYLHSDGRANGPGGDGRLSFLAPDREEPEDRFRYDPACPVPSLGGPVFLTGTAALVAGSYDQRAVQAREDVLLYTSAPLDRPVEVVGFLRAVLFVASSAPDTDFTVKLLDVHRDGAAYNVQEGILRMRYREGPLKRVAMAAGQVYRIEIDLQAIAIRFVPGHRIAVEVSSSNFPRFDRNLNTGGDNWRESAFVAATNRVLHSDRYPSHLLLPVPGGLP